MKLSIKNIILYSLFAALTAVLSQIYIPLLFTPVPINLATLSLFVSGAMLGAKGGLISQITYVSLGCVGIPVFSGFSVGIGTIVGPTGGYIIGYIFAAYVIGIIIEKSNTNFLIYPVAMTAGMIVCYMVGTTWFMFVTKSNLMSALIMCVFPFIPVEIIKIIVGSVLSFRLKRILKNQLT